MHVPPETATLETQAKIIRHASEAALEADAFERWGPKHDVAQAEAIFGAATRGERQRKIARAELEREVARLREQQPAAIEAWADAHIELLEHYCGPLAQDSTEVYVARQEAEQWARVRTGELTYVRQNTYYVHYDRGRYAALFGFDY